MATIIQVTEDKKDCIKSYAEQALEHTRWTEHKLTEILEKLDNIDK